VALANPLGRTNRPLAFLVRATELATFRWRPVPAVRFFDHIEVVCLLRWGGPTRPRLGSQAQSLS
jgi:hypothetical protein